MNDSVESAAASQAGSRQGWRPSLFTMILLALAAGIASGLFLGDYAEDLRIIGDAYVGLLQMTVLPYIVFSLISSIGRLSLTEGRRLAAVSIAVLAVLWGIGLIAVAVMAFALPPRVAGAFFSASLVESPEAVDFIDLFVPSNPFGALANNVAPAVVVFCLLFGVALIKIRSKESLLAQFDIVVTTLIRVNGFIVSLSPIGIFAITATAAGTLGFEEFGRLQAYLLTYALAALLLTLWVLPMLIAACTPFRYRDILAASKSALLTVFVVQSLFVVIPMLAEGIRELMEKYRQEGLDETAHPEFVIPLAYPFPHLGKVLTLIFIPFAAWFYGSPMAFTDYPLVLGTGLVLSFGKVVTTIPFLLDMQEIPADIFRLFLLSSVVAGGLSDLLGAMHLLAFTVLTTCVLAGLIRFNRAKLLSLLAFTLLIGGAMILSTRGVLSTASADAYSKEQVLYGMHLLQPRVQERILEAAAPNPVPLLPGQSRLERIQEWGVIRVGFHPDNLPFSFYSATGDLVGLDIDMAHRLAQDLGARVDFVPFEGSKLAEQLALDHFDIAMSGIGATTRRSAQMLLSDPYMDVTRAIVVPDHLKAEFADMESIRRRGRFRLGVLEGTAFARVINEKAPEAEIVELKSERAFFEDPALGLDVLLTSAEGGSAWTLIYPAYAVVNPLPRVVKLPLAYAYGGPDTRFEHFLEHWIALKRRDGTIERLYDYWILGRGAQARGPRWSVMRDVLQWVE